MKKLNQILNSIMGAFTGVFIGRSIFVLWNHKMRPELYAMQSAPWYTGILVDGVMTLVVLGSCFLLKLGLKYYKKKTEEHTGLGKTRERAE
ncbi:MAG: hypothetical protein IJN67_10400 [Oscillospiraceae bacterium]|nr:hypothetical protein [Oscillospiraceae bacterium]